MNKAPESLRHYSVDEVAECISGITEATYVELWNYLGKCKNPKPCGGDGSDGTFEEPVITSGEYESDLVAAWPHLSEAARQNITEVAHRD